MGTNNEKQRKSRIARMLVYGVLTVAMYAAVFVNNAAIMLYFTKGKVFAALPVMTALVFSFAHGGFTNYFWQVMGIEASKKRIQHRPEQRQPVERRQIRPQPRLRA